MDDLDVGGRLGAQSVGNLVALEGDLDADAAGFGLILHLSVGGHAQLVLLVDHEGEVIEQGVIGGIRLVGFLGVQGVHVGAVVVAVGAVGDGTNHELGIVRHVAGAAHADGGLDEAVLVIVDPLPELLLEAHDKRRVPGEGRGHVAGGVQPGAVGVAVGERVQPDAVQQGLDVIVAVEGDGAAGLQIVGALFQRLIHAAQDDGGLVGVVKGGILHFHGGIIRPDSDRQLGGQGLLAREGRDLGRVGAGLARRPIEGGFGLAGGDVARFIINAIIHPLGAGGIEGEVDGIPGEDLDGVRGEIGQREGSLLLDGLLNRFLGGFLGRLLRGLLGRLLRGLLGGFLRGFLRGRLGGFLRGFLGRRLGGRFFRDVFAVELRLRRPGRLGVFGIDFGLVFILRTDFGLFLVLSLRFGRLGGLLGLPGRFLRLGRLAGLAGLGGRRLAFRGRLNGLRRLNVRGRLFLRGFGGLFPLLRLSRLGGGGGRGLGPLRVNRFDALGGLLSRCGGGFDGLRQSGDAAGEVHDQKHERTQQCQKLSALHCPTLLKHLFPD